MERKSSLEEFWFHVKGSREIEEGGNLACKRNSLKNKPVGMSEWRGRYS